MRKSSQHSSNANGVRGCCIAASMPNRVRERRFDGKWPASVGSASHQNRVPDESGMGFTVGVGPLTPAGTLEIGAPCVNLQDVQGMRCNAALLNIYYVFTNMIPQSRFTDACRQTAGLIRRQLILQSPARKAANNRRRVGPAAIVTCCVCHSNFRDREWDTAGSRSG